MKNAYPKKLRFVDDPIDAGLIPDDCRDEYGVDAVKLVQHLAERCLRMSERAENAAQAADSLGGELHLKELQFKNMVSYAAERELERDRLAELLAKECRAKGDVEQDCWKCRLARDPHDCDKVTMHDWLEYVRWKEERLG